MKALDAFFESEENQKRYGFKCRKDSSCGKAIIYDGDFSKLMDIAYEAAGYIKVETLQENNDPRPCLSFALNDNNLILTDTGDLIETGVDGIGDEPNFFLRFQSGVESVIVRFSLIAPSIYPDDESCQYQFSIDSLTAINGFYRENCNTLIESWNALRPDMPISDMFIPNYRAIKRIQQCGR